MLDIDPNAEQIPIAEESNQDKADRTFKEAKAGFELFGEPLQAYTPSRKVAAQSMGLLYPFVGQAGAAQMEQTGMYPGSVKDAIIVLWLCTLPDEDQLTPKQKKALPWTPSRALARSGPALEVAVAWGSEKGIVNMESREFEEAYQVFMAIVSGVAVNEFKLSLAPRDEDGPGESEGTPDPKA